MEIVKLSSSFLKQKEKEVKKLLESSYESSFNENEYNNEVIIDAYHSMINHMENDNALVYGSIIDEKLMGMIWFFEKNNLNGSIIHLNHIIVENSYRGKGIGKLLLNKLESYAKNNHINEIELFVSNNNEQAIKFYKNHDYKTKRFLLTKEI